MSADITQTLTDDSKGWKVNVNGGEMNTTVSEQWRSRPVDERYLNLDDLYGATMSSARDRKERHVSPSDVRLFPNGEGVDVQTGDHDVRKPTHWAFSQLAQTAGAPARFLRKLSPETATQSFNEAWTKQRMERSMMFYESSDEIHAVTSTSYGRLHDHVVVNAVRDIAGSGRGENRWKIPGLIDWKTGLYDPQVPVTPETTTLFASDRDVFMFLVDDTRPIQIGTLPNGNPDYVFRGFYGWNSEVGLSTVGFATMLIRGVCANRILWGCENHQEIRIRHDSRAPKRFMEELQPALVRYSEASESDVLTGIQTAQKAIVAEGVDQRIDFLVKKHRFSKTMATEIIDTHIEEENFEPVSAWDFVQAITAYAKKIPYQDKRLAMEKRAANLMKACA